VGRWEGKTIIGLTGNIAVGKSVVRKMLQHLGAYTIDADELTHQVMTPGAPAYQPVVEMFGKFIVDDQGRIDRQKLGAIAFAVPEAMEKLEAIIHPIVNQFVQVLVTRAKQKVVVIEAIKLLESSLAESLDTVWVVDATPEIQLRRLIETRKMTPEDARRRISAQPPQTDKVGRANVVIQNNTSVEETWRQVQAAWNDLARGAAAPKPETRPLQPAEVRPATSTGTTGQLPPARKTGMLTPEQTAVVRPANIPRAEPAPAQPAPTPASVVRPLIEINARRGMPSNADAIARFISRMTGRSVSRMDIMIAFGQKSYLIAEEKTSGNIVGVVGWQVENLITRVDEFYIDPNSPREPVIRSLLSAMEDAASALKSEVSFIFLSPSSSTELVQSILNNGYQVLKLDDMKFPAWREAAHEMMNNGLQGLMKQIGDRIMKPI
jgi:dephospho-CoA kinase